MPFATLIIPAHGQPQLTARCLTAVGEHTRDVPHEVILIDDASPEPLHAPVGVASIRSPRQLGFVGACNLGAERARGEYLVFLNNDTEVQPGWLGALVAPPEADPKVGVVGAKLLSPNGRLQEAGGIVFADGSAWNYGRDDDPEKCFYEYPRDVDYCSGACLLVRRELFLALGGFDQRYAPGYYEDVHLSFAARAAGYRTVYQPRAEVVHVEGATGGTDLADGTKRHQAINAPKFAAAWASTLAREQHPLHVSPVRARDRRPGPRVLVVDHVIPDPRRDAGSVRMFHLLTMLADAGCVVSFLGDDFRCRQPQTSWLQDLGIEVLYGRFELDEYLREIGSSLSLVVLSRGPVAARHVTRMRELAPQARLVFDTVDLHHVRESRRAALTGLEADRRVADAHRELELALVRTCDATVVTSRSDERIVHREVPGARTYVFPVVSDVRDGGSPRRERDGLVFVGSFAHAPNRDAVVHLVADVMPQVRDRVPGVKLRVVGGDVPSEVAALHGDGVEVVGWVEDLDAELDRAVAMLAPIRYGAGMNGKIAAALGAGLPVITTRLGAEGLGATPGIELLVANDPDEWATLVARLYGDESLWEAIAVGGLELARRNVSPAAARSLLEGMLVGEKAMEDRPVESRVIA